MTFYERKQKYVMFIKHPIFLFQICAVNMNISKDICDEIQNHKQIQVDVQKYASELSAYNEIIQGNSNINTTYLMEKIDYDLEQFEKF